MDFKSGYKKMDGLHRVRCHLFGECRVNFYPQEFDPLYVANEGRFVAFVPGDQADRAQRVLAAHDVSAGAGSIGLVSETPASLVTLKSRIGATRIVDMLSGEQLPRIC